MEDILEVLSVHFTNTITINYFGIMTGSERNSLNSALISLLSWSRSDVNLCTGKDGDADSFDLRKEHR